MNKITFDHREVSVYDQAFSSFANNKETAQEVHISMVKKQKQKREPEGIDKENRKEEKENAITGGQVLKSCNIETTRRTNIHHEKTTFWGENCRIRICA